MIKEAIKTLVARRNLSEDEAIQVMREIMSGQATPSQIAAFLTALAMKGETIEELTAFAKVMREFATQIPLDNSDEIIDTCGTGGGLIKTFNVSTTAAFIAAGCGVKVAKHGNRAVTSKTGSADVLEKLGVNIHLTVEEVKRSIREVGVTFIFAPEFHPAMKYAAAPRREIGIKTIFNLLGPITNPAGVKKQLIGVYSEKLIVPLIYTLRNLNCKEALVVHGLDGLDEISTVGKTTIAWLKHGKITIFETKPEDFNVKPTTPDKLTVENSEESAETVFKILSGCLPRGDPARDFAVVNAAAAIILGGKAESFSEAVELANESVDSGQAYLKLRNLVANFNGDITKLEKLEEKYERLLRLTR
ncbi:MAG: anthranilate phosphoribosyltransferase [Candidatus Odinarchaeia archaeon]